MTDQDNDDLQLMTVLGPLQQESGIIKVGPVLMNEVFISSSNRSQPKHKIKSNSKEQQLAVTLENLSSVRSNPFIYTDNTILASENEAAEELQHLVKVVESTASPAILEMTSAANGRDAKACQRLSRRLGIHILVGSTCLPRSTFQGEESEIQIYQSNIEHMERELKFGIGTNKEDDYKNLTKANNNNNDESIIRASFLGPVEITSEFNKSEQGEIKAYAAVQCATNAPVILEVSCLQDVSKILDVIEISGGVLQKTIIAHADLLVHQSLQSVNDQETMQYLIEHVLQRGVVLSMDRYAVSSCAFFDFDQTYPTMVAVLDLVSKLIQSNPSYIHQLVLSSGIFLKNQFVKYGGVGFPVVMTELVPRLLSQKGLTQDQIDIMLCHNPRRLLQWWTAPPIPEKPKTYLTCTVCKTLFEPILGEYYTKYNFTYCDTKCLRKHRKLGFSSLEEGRT